MLEPDVTVTNVYEDRRIDGAGKALAIIRVQFRVGQFGPFVEHFPKETYTQQVRDDKLNAFAREVRTS